VKLAPGLNLCRGCRAPPCTRRGLARTIDAWPDNAETSPSAVAERESPSRGRTLTQRTVAVGQTRRAAHLCQGVPTTTGEAESNRSRQGLPGVHEASCGVRLRSEAAALSRLDNGLGLSDSHLAKQASARAADDDSAWGECKRRSLAGQAIAHRGNL
jgi:hypothetical protein